MNYAVLGSGPHPAGYHWVNFALHAVNIALVYLLGLLLFQETRLKERLAFAMAATIGLFSKESAVVVLAAMVIYDLAFHQTWRARGDPQQAAITLIEGLAMDSNNTQFTSELVNLYQQTEPRNCAVRNVVGSVSRGANDPFPFLPLRVLSAPGSIVVQLLDCRIDLGPALHQGLELRLPSGY